MHKKGSDLHEVSLEAFADPKCLDMAEEFLDAYLANDIAYSYTTPPKEGWTDDLKHSARVQIDYSIDAYNSLLDRQHISDDEYDAVTDPLDEARKEDNPENVRALLVEAGVHIMCQMFQRTCSCIVKAKGEAR